MIDDLSMRQPDGGSMPFYCAVCGERAAANGNGEHRLESVCEACAAGLGGLRVQAPEA